MLRRIAIATAYIISVVVSSSFAAELQVGKACPVTYQNEPTGILVFSKAWYHSSRSSAKYIAGDNATGIGIEIHLQNNYSGKVEGLNLPSCDRYRLIQVRETTARLFQGESRIQIDIPDGFDNPFYDNAPLEHGYGLHRTPIDDSDKPWTGRPYRDASVSIYDTPYVSDAWGVEGEHIDVNFETCAVCERDRGYDSILSCGSWGYRRDYMGGMTGWSEPEFSGVSCSATPSKTFQETLDRSHRVDYSYWINWR
ncbi:hypothetical protein [Neptuniibacter caesariensis]|uniref:Uncharacterized protein n=1 Tax=Neptuniibacter caesariensis TaxID=207954 RepID=A0A7U8C7E4_NEPCE|nr:hypothetical protein [Neptuniibacter caesariensis]EAR61266.1 hypothetical protein MED92_11084 [Oceanospirillum sp. MED92] [Neptuniibacter caesariensis]